jgi:hypothetical protein
MNKNSEKYHSVGTVPISDRNIVDTYYFDETRLMSHYHRFRLNGHFSVKIIDKTTNSHTYVVFKEKNFFFTFTFVTIP